MFSQSSNSNPSSSNSNSGDKSDNSSQGKSEKKKDIADLTNINSNRIIQGAFLGSGNFGDVFKGEWKGEEVAVKILKDPKNIAQFVGEAKTLAKLDHPNIIKVKSICIVMEYAHQGTLENYLTKNPDLSLETCYSMTCELVSALKELESKGLAYTDVSWDNILIDKDGHIKLADFGEVVKNRNHFEEHIDMLMGFISRLFKNKNFNISSSNQSQLQKVKNLEQFLLQSDLESLESIFDDLTFAPSNQFENNSEDEQEEGFDEQDQEEETQEQNYLEDESLQQAETQQQGLTEGQLNEVKSESKKRKREGENTEESESNKKKSKQGLFSPKSGVQQTPPTAFSKTSKFPTGQSA